MRIPDEIYAQAWSVFQAVKEAEPKKGEWLDRAALGEALASVVPQLVKTSHDDCLDVLLLPDNELNYWCEVRRGDELIVSGYLSDHPEVHFPRSTGGDCI